jgi:hypothetical protein
MWRDVDVPLAMTLVDLPRIWDVSGRREHSKAWQADAKRNTFPLPGTTPRPCGTSSHDESCMLGLRKKMKLTHVID